MVASQEPLGEVVLGPVIDWNEYRQGRELAPHCPSQDLQGQRRRPARHAAQEVDAADQHELEHDVSQDAHRYAEDVRGVAVGGALGRLLVAVNEFPVSRERSMVTRAPAAEAAHPLPRAADDGRHRRLYGGARLCGNFQVHR